MDYWRGMMDWPIDPDWKCETCGHQPVKVGMRLLLLSGLEWGFTNGQCRCTQCHTEYRMRVGEEILTVPKLMLKEEYKAAAAWAWHEWQIAIDKLTDDQWDEAMEAVNVKTAGVAEN